ncbi:MAG: primosomal replication protein N [Gammaproteobacteria bacterium]|nr:primosomal replication protein N [Gammaproteobacteria bacterium]
MSGQVDKAPQLRHTPAGIPITRFVLQHRSRQIEAGHPREVQCRILVMAAGEALAHRAEVLQVGEALRVEGFLSRSSHKGSEARLVLHAHKIENPPDDDRAV